MSATPRRPPDAPYHTARGIGCGLGGLDRCFDGSTAGDALDAAVQVAEATARAEAGVSRDMLERIERTVLFAFDLDPDLAPALLEAM